MPRSSLSAGRLATLAALILSMLLPACAGTFELRVRSSDPTAVGSVFVFFGKESEFQDKHSSVEIATLVLPSKLREYQGYAEYELKASQGGVVWKELSSSFGSLEVELSLPEGEPQQLVVTLGRGGLEAFPQLGLAVVVRTTEGKYLIRSWDHALIEQAEAPLIVDVTSIGVSEQQ